MMPPEDMPKTPPPPPPLNIPGGGIPGTPPGQFSATRSISEPRTPQGPPPDISGYTPMPPGRTVAVPPPPPTVAGVLRGQPPPFMPSPLSPPPPPGAELGLVPFTGAGGPPAPGMPGMGGALVPQIPPPPPPREDDQAFVRRVRLVYMDRVNREHERQDLAEDGALGTPTPGWVFSTATLLPYIACAAFTIVSVFVVLMYGIKFAPRGLQEENWYWASTLGLSVILFVLEIIRIAVMTIVELRRFEIRKRRKAGDFLTRRVKADGAEEPAILKSKPKRHAAPAPPVPKVAPKFSVQRPGFLPKPGPPMPPMLGPPGSSSGIPVAPGAPKPPPPAGSNMGSLPPPVPSQGLGNRPPPIQSGGPLLPGAIKNRITPPTTPSGFGGAPPPPPPPGGAGNLSGRSQFSQNAVNVLAQDMNDKLRNSRGPGAAPAPPPPVDAPGGRPGNDSGRSQGSRGSRGPPKPPPPPGAGTFVRGSTPPQGP